MIFTSRWLVRLVSFGSELARRSSAEALFAGALLLLKRKPRYAQNSCCATVENGQVYIVCPIFLQNQHQNWGPSGGKTESAFANFFSTSAEMHNSSVSLILVLISTVSLTSSSRLTLDVRSMSSFAVSQIRRDLTVDAGASISIFGIAAMARTSCLEAAPCSAPTIVLIDEHFENFGTGLSQWCDAVHRLKLDTSYLLLE